MSETEQKTEINNGDSDKGDLKAQKRVAEDEVEAKKLKVANGAEATVDDEEQADGEEDDDLGDDEDVDGEEDEDDLDGEDDDVDGEGEDEEDGDD